MINFKKIAALSLSAVCLLMSCNKTVNADGIKNFIKSTYGDSVKVKTFKEAKINMKMTCKDDVKDFCNDYLKNEANYYGVEYKDNSLSFTGKVTKNEDDFSDECKDKITTDDIDKYESYIESGLYQSSSYLISGNEMSVLLKNDNYKDGKLEAKFSEFCVYNSCGQLRYRKKIYDFEKDYYEKKYTLTEIVTFAFND